MELILTTTTKKDGSMGLSLDFDSPGPTRNRARFFRRLGIPPLRTVRAQLVHGARVVGVVRIPPRGFISGCDALVTNQPDIFLYILTADCFPVFFYNAENHIAGIIHGGWRSVVGGLLPKTIKALKRQFKINPNQLKVIVGSGIQKCHFEIKEDVFSCFKGHTQFIIRKRGKIFVDLAGIIEDQLKKNGVRPANVLNKNICTFHNNAYFSYRRDKSALRPRGAGNMISIIGWQKYTPV